MHAVIRHAKRAVFRTFATAMILSVAFATGMALLLTALLEG